MSLITLTELLVFRLLWNSSFILCTFRWKTPNNGNVVFVLSISSYGHSTFSPNDGWQNLVRQEIKTNFHQRLCGEYVRIHSYQHSTLCFCVAMAIWKCSYIFASCVTQRLTQAGVTAKRLIRSACLPSDRNIVAVNEVQFYDWIKLIANKNVPESLPSFDALRRGALEEKP